MTSAPTPYLMSFGTGGLNVSESAEIAHMRLSGREWDAIASAAVVVDVFRTRKSGSAKRLVRETMHRLRSLTDGELAVVASGNHPEQAAMLWLAACRTYRFIGEWATELLDERALSWRTDVTYADFDAFLARKAADAPELVRLTEATRAKLRAVLFRFMREGGLLDGERLVGGALPQRVADRVDRGDLRFFPGAER